MVSVCFAGCEKTPKDNGEKLMVKGVGEYTIVRADNPTKTVQKAVSNINSLIYSLTGKDLAVESDWVDRGTEPDSEKKEILVGDTNRPESKEVIESLTDHTFAVKRVGNKIVIAGQNDYMVSCAVAYFMDTVILENGYYRDDYLSVGPDIDYELEDEGFITLSTGKKTDYYITYTKDFNPQYEYSYWDYRFNYKIIAEQLAGSISEKFGTVFSSSTDVVFNKDTVDDAKEILLGNTEREATARTKAGLNYNEFAIKIDGNKIVVTGLGFMTTFDAKETFVEILDFYKKTENGVTTLRLPANFNYTGIYSEGGKWNVNIPEYEGGTFDSASALLDDAYLIKINDTSEDEYNAYLEKLEDNGYEKYADNEISGNLFATYKSEKSVIHVYYAPVYNYAKIIVEPGNAPLFGLEEDNDDTDVTTPQLTSLKLVDRTTTNGMCQIIRLNNGKFIVVDGGGETDNADNIYATLKEQNVLGGKPVIAAWIFTHDHGDHTAAFAKGFTMYYLKDVIIESLVYSFPVDGYYIEDLPNLWNYRMPTYKNFIKATSGLKHITPHAGDVMYAGNAKITFLYTQDQYLPNTFEFYNDSSLTFMIEIEGQKILITGDASENSCNTMCDMYGDYMKCDILQVPHHGRFGGNIRFFDATDPTYAFVPVEKERFNKQMTFVTELVYVLRKKNVKEYTVSGKGTKIYPLPYSGS